MKVMYPYLILTCKKYYRNCSYLPSILRGGYGDACIG